MGKSGWRDLQTFWLPISVTNKVSAYSKSRRSGSCMVIWHKDITRTFLKSELYTVCGCAGSSLLCAGFLWLQQAGAPAHCGVWTSHRGGFSSCRAWALECAGFSNCGARAEFLRVACGIFPDQGSNPCPLRWQADS